MDGDDKMDIEIHKAKEIVQLLNEQAQVILSLDNLTASLKKQLLHYIDDIKAILCEAKTKEEK